MTIEEYIEQNIDFWENFFGKRESWNGKNYDKIMLNIKLNYKTVIANMKSAEYLTPLESSFESQVRSFWEEKLDVEKPKEGEVVIMEFAWHGQNGHYLRISENDFIYNAVDIKEGKINKTSIKNSANVTKKDLQLLVEKISKVVKEARECPESIALDGTEYIVAAYTNDKIKLGKVHCPSKESNMGKLLKEVNDTLGIKK